jgi:hypothetical protein
MSQIFREYFKGNNIKIFIKYDGERKSKIFTVMIIDKDDFQNTVSINTDEPFEVFQELLNEFDISISLERDELYFDTFSKLKNEIEKIMKSDYVFICTLELNEEMEFYISIQSQEITSNFNSTDINEIFNFISSFESI